jgi:hypothetical protein
MSTYCILNRIYSTASGGLDLVKALFNLCLLIPRFLWEDDAKAVGRGEGRRERHHEDLRLQLPPLVLKSGTHTGKFRDTHGACP